MKKHLTHTAYITIIVFVLFLLFRQCSITKDSEVKSENIANFLQDKIESYENELGQVVSQKQALQGDNKSLQILLNKQIDSTGQLKRLLKNFKKVYAAGNINQETKIDTIEIVYRDTIPAIFRRDWSKNTDYYTIAGISTQKGNTITDLRVPNTLSFGIGDRKTGFFHTEYRIEAVNSNPYIINTGLDAYTLKQRNKRIGLGLIAGYGLSDQGLSPIVGLGVSYSLFRF